MMMMMMMMTNLLLCMHRVWEIWPNLI